MFYLIVKERSISLLISQLLFAAPDIVVSARPAGGGHTAVPHHRSLRLDIASFPTSHCYCGLSPIFDLFTLTLPFRLSVRIYNKL